MEAAPASADPRGGHPLPGPSASLLLQDDVLERWEAPPLSSSREPPTWVPSQAVLLQGGVLAFAVAHETLPPHALARDLRAHPLLYALARSGAAPAGGGPRVGDLL